MRLNAKIAKALRRMVRDSMQPGTEKKKYVRYSLSKVIVLDKGTLDHAYKQLLEAYETRPEVRQYVHQMMGYRKVLHAQDKVMRKQLPPSG